MTDEKKIQIPLEDALKMDIPHLYANSLHAYAGGADVALVLRNFEEPIATLNMSHNLAKALVSILNGLIQEIEKKTGQQIKTPDDVVKSLGIGGE